MRGADLHDHVVSLVLFMTILGRTSFDVHIMGVVNSFTIYGSGLSTVRSWRLETVIRAQSWKSPWNKFRRL